MPQTKRWTPLPDSLRLYAARSVVEDQARTNIHYEQPAEFFTCVLGGTWNVYSANVWRGDMSETQSQEAKLDLLAELMDLQPGQRILDVGSGWGGPLVYLCKRYGVRGVGLMLSPTQREFSETRAKHHGVDATFIERHWQDYVDAQPFDAVYVDEVSVHFEALEAFFRRAKELLRPGGRVVNKELHFAHARYAEMKRGLAFLNELFGGTGNYRTLAEELRCVGAADLDLVELRQIPREDYRRTMDHWIANMQEHRAELEGIVGADYYRRFRTFLKLGRHALGDPTMTVDIVVGRKPVER